MKSVVLAGVVLFLALPAYAQERMPQPNGADDARTEMRS